jgi:hypothetical protein
MDNNKCCCHNYNGHFSSVIKCECIIKPEDHSHDKNRHPINKHIGITGNKIEKKKKCCS